MEVSCRKSVLSAAGMPVIPGGSNIPVDGIMPPDANVASCVASGATLHMPWMASHMASVMSAKMSSWPSLSMHSAMLSGVTFLH